LLTQFTEQSLRQGILFFTARGEGKDNFGERPEIAAVFRGLGLVLLVVVILDLQRESKFRERSARSLHGWF
jgi:hypothetical protein